MIYLKYFSGLNQAFNNPLNNHLWFIFCAEYDIQEILDPSLPNQEFDLLDLHPYTKYEVRVRAANRDEGQDLWGPFSPSLTLQTRPARTSLSSVTSF